MLLNLHGFRYGKRKVKIYANPDSENFEIIALDRYIALRCPIRYHNETTGLNPWGRALCLSWPLALLSSVFVIPLAFEANLIAVEDFSTSLSEELDPPGVTTLLSNTNSLREQSLFLVFPK